MLEITGLHVVFGGLHAINNLDFTVEEGEIVAVIGPNGAGKTTFFNAVSGMVKPTEGQISFEGRSLLGLDPNQITSRGIARTFQNVRLFANMTVLENVLVSQHCRTRQGILDALLQTRRFRTEEELFRDVNHATYGLTAYCYTRDLARAFRTAAVFRCGFVGVNDRRPQGAEVPMGGVGESGLGREGGHWGIEEFTTIKYVSMRV